MAIISSKLRRVHDQFRVFLVLEFTAELSVMRGLTMLAAEIGRYAREAHKRSFSVCLDVVCNKTTSDTGLPHSLCEAAHRYVYAMHGKVVSYFFTGISQVGAPLIGKDIWFSTAAGAEADREQSLFAMMDPDRHTIIYPPLEDPQYFVDLEAMA